MNADRSTGRPAPRRAPRAVGWSEPSDVNGDLAAFGRAGARRTDRSAASRSPTSSQGRVRQYANAAASSTRPTCARSPGPRPFDAFNGADVYYAGKAFLCTEVARWVDEEGLCLDVCTGGELAVALAAGFPPERLIFHGNNKSRAELERAIAYGVGRIIVDSFTEIERLADRRCRARSSAGAGSYHGRGRGPHARIHRDRARGPEVRLQPAGRRRRAVAAGHGRALARVRRLALAHRLADLRHAGFEVAAHRVIELAARCRRPAPASRST